MSQRGAAASPVQSNPRMQTIDTVKDKAAELHDKVVGQSKQEGTMTRKVEEVTASIPSFTWMAVAGVSMAGAIALKLAGKHNTANFVGQWVPTFLLIGLYNKIVKVAGSERNDHGNGLRT